MALALAIPCGGHCPKGRLAEDGVIAAKYPLAETASADAAERTRRNVEAADATLILNRGRLDGGTLLTRDHARALGRPHLVVDLDAAAAFAAAAAWLRRVRPSVLNVAGPRETASPGIHDAAAEFLGRLFAVTRRS